MTRRLTRAELEMLDTVDPLARHRAGFDMPDGIIYLDGNSLGALPRTTPMRLAETAKQQWARDLIGSWNKHGWIDLPRRIGDKIAKLIGAAPGEVVVADSTSVNVFKVLASALTINAGRKVILSEPENFPTDLYMAQGLIKLLGARHELRLITPDKLAGAIDADTAAVMLTHVNYQSGAVHDMAAITRAAHAKGALVIWDLCHSAGALPVDLRAASADFAVGCGYKYLNGGPGAPAFVYVAQRHHERFTQPLSGWLGHAAPFAFETMYRPAEGVGRFVCGSPPILSMVALESGVDSVLAADMIDIRAKSVALTGLFIELVERECIGSGLSLVSPHDPERRGSQVSFRHPDGYPIMQALIARGVVGDFRAPDILRFGFAPLYLRHVDVWDAVAHLKDVLATRAWDAPEFRRRAMVT
jgi:kynureninase